MRAGLVHSCLDPNPLVCCIKRPTFRGSLQSWVLQVSRDTLKHFTVPDLIRDHELIPYLRTARVGGSFGLSNTQIPRLSFTVRCHSKCTVQSHPSALCVEAQGYNPLDRTWDVGGGRNTGSQSKQYKERKRNPEIVHYWGLSCHTSSKCQTVSAGC